MTEVVAAIGMSMLLAGCMSSLENAASNGQTDRLLSLLQAKPRPQDRAMGLALIQASKNGRDEIVKLLLDGGADVNFGNQNTGWSPLTIAAAYQHPSTVKLLLSRGAASDGMPEFLDQYGQPQGARLLRQLTTRAQAAATPSSETRPAVARPPSAGAAGDASIHPFQSDVDSPRYKRPERSDDFALVIGIEDYQSLPKADYGVRDAQAVRSHLEALGFPPRNIVSLEGASATKSKLQSYLQEWLPLNIKPSSTLLVYYSGHGAPDPKSGAAYLVPWDADPKFLKSSAYSLKQFYAELAKLPAKQIIVALDACFSGAGGRSALAEGAKPLVAKVDDLRPNSKISVLAAASSDEITGTLTDQGHGMFTYFLLKGLVDGKRSTRELMDYLKSRVQDEARRQNREQTPALLGADAPL